MAVRDVPRHAVHDAFLRPSVCAPLEPAHRAVGADVPRLEPEDVRAVRELGEVRGNGFAIVGVDVVQERPGQQLLFRVPEDARERRIGELQVPVEPGNAERIKRQIDEPYQLVVGRPSRLTHVPQSAPSVRLAKGRLSLVVSSAT